MNKLLLSIATLGVVGALAAGATSAIFSDDEVSTGNTFTAGAVDLKIDNTSYYNGVLNQGTTWLEARDLDDGNGPGPGGQYLFFNFDDLKPGDFGEDTISLHVDNNDSWLCVDVTLTSDDDNGLTEPEEVDGDATDGADNGELADAVNFIWWADDGDNVLETDEQTLPSGPLGNLSVGQTFTQPLVDSQNNIWGTIGEPFPGDQTRYIAKAWCFGDMVQTPVAQDGFGPIGTPGQEGSNGPDQRGAGFTCDGSSENNITQTDSMTADIIFHTEQSRNNESFVCEPLPQDVGTLTVNKVVEGGDAQISDFALSVNGEPVESGVGEEFPADVLLTVSEVDGSGLYEATFTGNCNASGEITLTTNQNATCTITNTYSPAALTVDKIVQFSSDTLAVTVNDFNLFIDDGIHGQIQVTDQVIETGLPAGTYTVSEVYTGGLDIIIDQQFSGACSDNGTTGTVVLEAGDSDTCTIVNVISPALVE